MKLPSFIKILIVLLALGVFQAIALVIGQHGSSLLKEAQRSI